MAFDPNISSFNRALQRSAWSDKSRLSSGFDSLTPGAKLELSPYWIAPSLGPAKNFFKWTCKFGITSSIDCSLFIDCQICWVYCWLGKKSFQRNHLMENFIFPVSTSSHLFGKNEKSNVIFSTNGFAYDWKHFIFWLSSEYFRFFLFCSCVSETYKFTLCSLCPFLLCKTLVKIMYKLSFVLGFPFKSLFLCPCV